MRIVHVSDFYLPRQGGIELHVRDLATRQQAAGHTVEIITCSRSGRPERRRAEDGTDGLRIHRVSEHALPPWTYHPRGLVVGRRLVRRGGYDIVHAHMSLVSPLSFAVAAGAAGSVPLVVTAHSMAGRAEPLFRALDGAIGWSDWPAAWTAVSAVAAQPVQRLVGPEHPVHVLPNGIDASYWQVEPIARATDEVVVAAVMRLARRKRPIPLLRLLREARRQLDPAIALRAVVVGEGAERASMQHFLDRNAMSDWVHLPGHWDRERIRSLLARADVFVAPAILETFGIAALEARCAGVPVLARSQGGIAEFITHGQEGLLADDDDAMASSLARLAADPRQRAAMSAHNSSTVPPLTWDDVLARADDIYAAAWQATRPQRVTVA